MSYLAYRILRTYPTLPYPTLPYPILPYPTLPYLTLPYPTLSYPILPPATPPTLLTSYDTQSKVTTLSLTDLPSGSALGRAWRHRNALQPKFRTFRLNVHNSSKFIMIKSKVS